MALRNIDLGGVVACGHYRLEVGAAGADEAPELKTRVMRKRLARVLQAHFVFEDVDFNNHAIASRSRIRSRMEVFHAIYSLKQR